MLRLILLAAILPAAACTSDQTMRYDGVTPGAGDAIAANTVMQMVDPWQKGVEDTELIVRSATAAPAAPTAAAGDAQAPSQPTPMGVSN